MISLVQAPDETVYGYAMHCIEMHQKVLIASQKADGISDITFDKDLVVKLFLRTL